MTQKTFYLSKDYNSEYGQSTNMNDLTQVVTTNPKIYIRTHYGPNKILHISSTGFTAMYIHHLICE